MVGPRSFLPYLTKTQSLQIEEKIVQTILDKNAHVKATVSVQLPTVSYSFFFFFPLSFFFCGNCFLFFVLNFFLTHCIRDYVLRPFVSYSFKKKIFLTGHGWAFVSDCADIFFFFLISNSFFFSSNLGFFFFFWVIWLFLFLFLSGHDWLFWLVLSFFFS